MKRRKLSPRKSRKTWKRGNRVRNVNRVGSLTVRGGFRL